MKGWMHVSDNVEIGGRKIGGKDRGRLRCRDTDIPLDIVTTSHTQRLWGLRRR